MFCEPDGISAAAEGDSPAFFARNRFPRGLFQPEGSFRFSSDALLLACFPSLDGASRVLDLGAGCGVVGLGLLCRSPELEVTGIDRLPELVAAASRNAALLGFGERYTALHGDLAGPEFRGRPPFEPGSFDLVLANPPWRQRDRGRLPASPSRLAALFETASTQEDFCTAAALALKPGGRFALIYPWDRQKEIRRVLMRHRLFPARSLPLAPKPLRPAGMLLMECLKAAPETAPDHLQHNPLALHEPDGSFSAEALAFCPFLRAPSR